MAIYKPIKQDDGVTTNYHRIQLIQSVINHHTSIAVLSYIDKESRDTEVGITSPYKRAITYEAAYMENVTVAEAYDFLKTLEAFDGAEDVLEEDEVQNGE